jgi:hypothetical protein
MSLGAGTPDRTAAAKLRRLDVAKAFAPESVRDQAMAQACLAGLWLRFDFLDESHRISQEIHTPEGSYWHAILHRREPDPGNAKYWFRRVGQHPIHQQLAERSAALGHTYTDPFDFVDHCERVRGTGGDEEKRAQQVQALEWELLFDWCYRNAVA